MNEMYHITADKQKRKYGYISNLIYYMKSMKEWDKWMFCFSLLIVIPAVAASYLGTLLPASLVAGLEKQGSLL